MGAKNKLGYLLTAEVILQGMAIPDKYGNSDLGHSQDRSLQIEEALGR
jgi:hypothetical protein